jgi:hypothetical protein
MHEAHSIISMLPRISSLNEAEQIRRVRTEIVLCDGHVIDLIANLVVQAVKKRISDSHVRVLDQALLSLGHDGFEQMMRDVEYDSVSDFFFPYV